MSFYTGLEKIENFQFLFSVTEILHHTDEPDEQIFGKSMLLASAHLQTCFSRDVIQAWLAKKYMKDSCFVRGSGKQI